MAKYYKDAIKVSRSLGAEFEDSLAISIEDHFVAAGDRKAVQRTGGTRLDWAYGTDLFIWGIPVDLTCAIAGKDHIEKLPLTTEVFGIKVEFAVRTANYHHRFRTPVLVIGFASTESFARAWMDRITEEFCVRIEEIMDMAQSQYWDWCDANGLA